MRQLINIPNLLTCLNLLCGTAAIIATCNRHIESAVFLVCISLIADFLDGFTARLLGISSPVGKELDSLADVVTFGVLPGIILFYLLAENHSDYETTGTIPLYAYSGLMIGAFSALRLAKFNLDERQSSVFFGLATPANTIFVFSIWLIKYFHPDSAVSVMLTSTPALLILIPVLSYLLISELKLVAFKFKTMSLKDNFWKWMIIGVSLLLVLIFQLKGLVFVIPSYILLSVVGEKISKKKVVPSESKE